MRNPAKGNAACWDCKFYVTNMKLLAHDDFDNPPKMLTINQPVCTVSGMPVLVPIMPMKCEEKEKA
jgi:hypothetical protein